MKQILFAVVLLLSLRVVAAEKPNVLFIISDDHAWSDYSFMGSAVAQTPALDKLAKQSLTFRRGYVTCSLCAPSLASIISGRYPHETLITGNEPPAPAGQPRGAGGARYKNPEFLALVKEQIDHLAAMPLVPRELGKAGYVSLQTGKWWGGNFSSGGFTEGMTVKGPEEGGRHGGEGLAIGRQTMQPIYDFIEKAGAKPWMVWYAPLLPHDPHTPPERLLAKYRDKSPSLHVAKYWAMVEWFDETCGQLLDHLDAKKLSDNTIVVYIADNGWVQNPETGRFMPHSKLSPYDKGLRQPLMIRWPKKIAARFDDTPVSAIDIAPTIYAACGIEIPKGLPGINLLDAEAVKKRGPVFGSIGLHNAVDIRSPGKNTTYRWCVDGDWKLIVPNPATVTAPLLAGHAVAPELYNIVKDPEEKTDLAAAQPERVAALTKLLDGWWDGNPAK